MIDFITLYHITFQVLWISLCFNHTRNLKEKVLKWCKMMPETSVQLLIYIKATNWLGGGEESKIKHCREENVVQGRWSQNFHLSLT